MFVLANMWFQTLIRQFFFIIDKHVFGFISTLYDLLITIARTSVLSQADIMSIADRIYKLLAVFMVFKVTFSLIMYVVNPDDFSDKSKGVGKLGMNIAFVLAILILTPYIFNYAYQLQTIILEDNSLANLVFGKNDISANTFETAGDKIAFMTMEPFFMPDASIEQFYECTQLTTGTDREGNLIFNPDCSGLDENFNPLEDDNSLYALTDNSKFKVEDLKNYITGVRLSNFGLMFRQDLAVATVNKNKDYVMDYKIIFSTAVGLVVVFILISFCMDVAIRSIKLAFLQLIAPIPIISYVDPKSGKDGLFKKWYQMCFKTYISLFVRLLALYFAVHIISKINNLVDIVDGSYVSNLFVKIFIIIGALMFAKQLPKILEGLGLKLDGGFTLNPLKKIENEALGGKQISKGIKNTGRGALGLATGAAIGTVGALSGAGVFKGLTGALSGMSSGLKGKKIGEIRKQQIEANNRMRQARLDNSTLGGRLGARITSAIGAPTRSQSIEGQIHGIDEQIKDIDNQMAPSKKLAEEKKLYTDAVAAMEKRAVEKIENGEAGELSKEYRRKQAHIESLKARLDAEARAGRPTDALEAEIADEENKSRKYLNEEAMQRYIDVNMNGSAADRTSVFGKADGGDAALESMTKKMETIVETYGDHHDNMKTGSASDLHTNLGRTKGEITAIENENEEAEKRKRDLNEEKQNLYDSQRVAKANETAVKK